jgi:hypothetical protein
VQGEVDECFAAFAAQPFVDGVSGGLQGDLAEDRQVYGPVARGDRVGGGQVLFGWWQVPFRFGQVPVPVGLVGVFGWRVAVGGGEGGEQVHGVRWRPDREPQSCTYAQLEEPVNFDLAEVLATKTP